MESGKQINISAPSSPENVGDHHEEERSMEEDDHTGVGRSYECNFCKRGFTNAQALGGHMNIHRKDKAKAKQKNQEPHQPSISNVRRSGEIYSHTPYQIPPLDRHHKEQNLNYNMSIGGQGSHNMYQPSSNPNFQTGNLHCLRLEQYRYGYDHENLTLGVGPKPFVEEDDDDDAKENEIDLELRLGHDPGR